jgi:molybdate transport system regulatory protein
MNMPYRMAWCVLDRFEEALGLRLVEKKMGGPSGGGSWLTGPGQRFVGQYEQFRAEALRALNDLFRKHFTG